jgi:hypothetical protein
MRIDQFMESDNYVRVRGIFNPPSEHETWMPLASQILSEVHATLSERTRGTRCWPAEGGRSSLVVAYAPGQSTQTILLDGYRIDPDSFSEQLQAFLALQAPIELGSVWKLEGASEHLMVVDIDDADVSYVSPAGSGAHVHVEPVDGFRTSYVEVDLGN